MRILTIDVGGTNVKVQVCNHEEVRKIPSGRDLTAARMVEQVLAVTADWQYDVISIGYPGPVLRGKLLQEPVNLGPGWMDFDFAARLGKPVRIINDAAMQALGSYEGGRMLFLGLGTGMGAALVIENTLVPLEIAHLPYRKETFEDYVGVAGMDRLGKKEWRDIVADVVSRLKAAFIVEYVVLGGGNSKKLKELPEGARLGDNLNAFVGGYRLWEEKFHC